MATILSHTPSSQGNQKKWTFSVWVKRTKLGALQSIFGSGTGSYHTRIYFDTDDKLKWNNYSGGSYAGQKHSNAVFRDTNGWSHFVFRVDTTSSTASERMRMYVNGEQITSLGTSGDPSQNQNFEVGHTGVHYIGGYSNSADFEGVMSHFHYCDAQTYAPTEFGETDSTTGEWKIKTSPSVSYGVSGAFILKNGNSLTDQSGLGNNWSVGSGTLTKTEDNPSNNFATWYADSFDKGNQVSFSNGNNTTADAGGTSDYDPKAWTTLGANTGKYYCEMKLTAFNTGRSYRAGVWFTNGNFSHESNANCFSGVKYTITGNAVTIYSFGSDVQSGLASFSAGDILGVAVDIDNGTIQYYKNGATYGSQITGLSSNFSGKSMMFCHTGEAGGGRTFTIDANFGNGYFGTTAVSSAGTNASGNGIFEYDVPTGYTALSTKGLNL